MTFAEGTSNKEERHHKSKAVQPVVPLCSHMFSVPEEDGQSRRVDIPEESEQHKS
jgi:hypothetical protein